MSPFPKARVHYVDKFYAAGTTLLTEAGGEMTIREVAEILAAAEGGITTTSNEDITRTTGTMMDGTATAALGTTEVAPTTIEAGSSSSRSSPEGAQTGAIQAEEVRSCSPDILFEPPCHQNLSVQLVHALCTP